MKDDKIEKLKELREKKKLLAHDTKKLNKEIKNIEAECDVIYEYYKLYINNTFYALKVKLDKNNRLCHDISYAYNKNSKGVSKTVYNWKQYVQGTSSWIKTSEEEFNRCAKIFDEYIEKINSLYYIIEDARAQYNVVKDNILETFRKELEIV